MRAGWQTRPLGEICGIALGRTPPRANELMWDKERRSGNVWLSIADLLDVENKRVHDSKEYLSDRGAATSRLVAKGTLLVSFKLTLGRLAFAGRDLYTNEAIAALTILDPSVISEEFLYYSLSEFDWIRAAQDDVKLKGMTLNKAKLKVIPISFPGMSDQLRIVRILDEAFAGMTQTRECIQESDAKLEEIFESRLAEVFDPHSREWTRCRLGDVCETTSGGTPLKSRDEYYERGNIPWILSGEVGNRFVAHATHFITPRGLAQSSAKLFPVDTVLVAMYGATAGQVGILKIEAATNQAVCGILPGEHFLPDFLYYAMLAEKARLVAKAIGNAQPNISQAKIRDTVLPAPPLVEQAEVVGQLDELSSGVRNCRKIYTEQLRALDELKQSLLHHAFTGQL